MTIKNTLALPMIGLSLATLSTFAGCDPQVDDDYSGEALATMRGSITNERSVTPPQAYAGLLWTGNHGGDESDFAVGESIVVSGGFPAQFELNLFVPPPDEVLMALEPPYGPVGVEIGLAFIGAFDVAPEQLDLTEEEGFTHILGLAENHIVIYSNTDLPDGVAGYIYGPIQAGYTLMRVERITDADRQAHQQCIDEVNAAGTESWEICPRLFDKLYPVETNLDTEVPLRLVDDFEDLDVPNIG